MSESIEENIPAKQKTERIRFSLREMGLLFDKALDDALDLAEKGLAIADFKFRDNIDDSEHLDSITVTDMKGNIIFYQDFNKEKKFVAKSKPPAN